MLVQTNPVNRITNFPNVLCVFNRSMQVSVSEKYPQVYRLATQRAQNSVPSPRWTFVCGLSSPNKLKTPKMKCAPEISVFYLSVFCFVLEFVVKSSTCRCYLE